MVRHPRAGVPGGGVRPTRDSSVHRSDVTAHSCRLCGAVRQGASQVAHRRASRLAGLAGCRRPAREAHINHSPPSRTARLAVRARSARRDRARLILWRCGVDYGMPVGDICPGALMRRWLRGSYADHRSRSRRDESPRPRSGSALKRRAPHRPRRRSSPSSPASGVRTAGAVRGVAGLVAWRQKRTPPPSVRPWNPARRFPRGDFVSVIRVDPTVSPAHQCA